MAEIDLLMDYVKAHYSGNMTGNIMFTKVISLIDERLRGIESRLDDIETELNNQDTLRMEQRERE